MHTGAQPGTSLAAGSAVGVVVRGAQRNDLSCLAELVREEVAYAQRLAGYYRLTADFDWLGFAKHKLNSPARRVLVAERAERVVGFIDLRLCRYEPPTRSRFLPRIFNRHARAAVAMPLEPMAWGTIEACFVAERNRSRGIGRALVSAGMARFKQDGIRRVELGVLVANSAVTFWESLGFRTWRLQMYVNLEHDDRKR